MCMLVIAAGSHSSSAKRYTKISFWQLLREEIGSAVTESWLIFDQHCLDWQFDPGLVSSVFRWRFLSLTSCVSALSKDTNDLVRLSSLSTHILRERPKPNHLKQLVSTMSWDVFLFFCKNAPSTLVEFLGEVSRSSFAALHCLNQQGKIRSNFLSAFPVNSDSVSPSIHLLQNPFSLFATLRAKNCDRDGWIWLKLCEGEQNNTRSLRATLLKLS